MHLLLIGTAILFLLATATWTAAQSYPTKPVRLIVPFTPGGSQDVLARLLGEPAGQALGQRIVVDNRAGAGGLIAAQETARAAKDGYTLFLSTGAQMGIGPALQANAGYDPVKDFTHIIHVTNNMLVLIAHPSLPVANAKELVAYSLANRGKVNTASTGNGTYTHLTLELFKQATGADLRHVPYKGAAPAINELLGRQIQAMFTTTASAQPYLSSGRLKALGVTAEKRSSAFPDVPTFTELGISGLNVSVWVGISAPAGLPAPVVERVAQAFTVALQAPGVTERVAALGSEIAGVTGRAFAQMVQEDSERWAKLVKSANIRIE
jgi:tripartite-type tricarboxylate transporter receptor subunit TctC